MKNFKNTELIMMATSRNLNPDYDFAYKSVVDVFNFMDKRTHTNHCEILRLLYECDKRKHTYEGIATKVAVSDNALRRYRRMYTEWFNYYLEVNSNR